MDLSHTARVRLTELATTLRGTKYDYAEAGHCCQRAAQRELALLHKAGKVWVSGWEKRYYQWIPIYSPGHRKDVPKPPPVPGAERQRRYRAKTPEQQEQARIARRDKRASLAVVGKNVWETSLLQLSKGGVR